MDSRYCPEPEFSGGYEVICGGVAAAASISLKIFAASSRCSLRAFSLASCSSLSSRSKSSWMSMAYCQSGLVMPRPYASFSPK